MQEEDWRKVDWEETLTPQGPLSVRSVSPKKRASSATSSADGSTNGPNDASTTCFATSAVLEIIQARTGFVDTPVLPISPIVNQISAFKELQTLDLSGLQQVSDILFFKLWQLEVNLSVSEVRLAGCSAISDFGVLMILRKFKNSIRLLDLSGCRKVTNASVSYILHTHEVLKSLVDLRICGTKVSNVYQLLNSFPRVKVQFGDGSGMLLVSDPKLTSAKFRHAKFIVLNHPNLPNFTLSALVRASQSDKPQNSSFRFTSWQAEGSDGRCDVSLIEVDIQYLNLVLSSRCAVIIPYPNSDEHDTNKQYVSSVVTHVLANFSDVNFLLFCVVSAEKSKPVEAKELEELSSSLESRSSAIHSAVPVYKDSISLRDLERVSQITSLKTRLEMLITGDHPHSSIKTALLDARSQRGLLEASKLLNDSLRMSNFCCNLVDPKVIEAVNAFPTVTSKKVVKVQELIDFYVRKGETYLGRNAETYRNLLEFMNSYGLLVLNDNLVISDLNWLAEALFQLQLVAKKQTESDLTAAVKDGYFLQNLCDGNATRGVLLSQSLLSKWHKAIKLSEADFSLFMEFLSRAHILVPHHLHRLNSKHLLEHKSSLVLCQPARLHQLALCSSAENQGMQHWENMVDSYWPKEYSVSESAVKLELCFAFAPLAEVMFAAVFAKVSKFACPALAFSKLLLFELGFVTVKLSFLKDKILLEARCDLEQFKVRNSQEDSGNGLEALQQTVMQFALLVECSVAQLGNDVQVRMSEKRAMEKFETVIAPKWNKPLITAAPFHCIRAAESRELGDLNCLQCGWSLEQCCEFRDSFYWLYPNVAQESVMRWSAEPTQLSVVDLNSLSPQTIVLDAWANPVAFAGFSFVCLSNSVYWITIRIQFNRSVPPMEFVLQKLHLGDRVTFTARYVRAPNMADVGKTMLAQQFSVLVNEAIHSEKLLFNMDALWKVRIQPTQGKMSSKDYRIALDLRNLPRLSWTKQPNEIQVDQKLEVEDSGTLYVATVLAIGKEKLTVGFDGILLEGKRHSIQLPRNSPALHPAGYAQQTGQTSLLQIPPEYDSFIRLQRANVALLESSKASEFNWSTYLQLTASDPVPLSAFIEQQTQNNAAIFVTGFEYNQQVHCTRMFNSSPHNVTQLLDKNAARCVNLLQRVLAQHTLVVQVMPCLDELLSRQPSVAQVHLNMRRPFVHLVCSTLDCVHFVDAPGLNILKDEIMSHNNWHSLLFFTFLLAIKQLDQDCCVTDSVAALFSDGKLSSEKVKRKLRRVLYVVVTSILGANGTLLKQLFSDSGVQLLNTAVQLALDVVSSANSYSSLVDYYNKLVIKKNPAENEPVVECAAHVATRLAASNLTSVTLEPYIGAFCLITSLDLSNNRLQELPEQFASLVSLRSLNLSQNLFEQIPAVLLRAIRLNAVQISENLITKLPDSFDELSKSLLHLDISGNPIRNLPESLFTCRRLLYLNVSNLLITELPRSVGQLSELRVLLVNYNSISTLPSTFNALRCLQELQLSGLPWVSDVRRNDELLLRSSLDELLNTYQCYRALSSAQKDSLYNQVDLCTSEQAQVVNQTLFNCVARVREVPVFVFELPSLRKLQLSYQAIRTVGDEVRRLKQLQVLSVDNCAVLETISHEIGKLSLTTLNVASCRSLKTIPKEVIARGFSVVMSYMKKLSMGSSVCRRTRLMLVGLGGAGKTSLAKFFVKKRLQITHGEHEKVTDGIIITPWSLSDPTGKKEPITFLIWDFAGQTVYYNTHQFFFSNRGVYVLVWNVRLGHEHAGLDFWITSISCHAPLSPIIIVGTHLDEVEQHFFPEAKYRALYPQIRSFHYVSCVDGRGLDTLIAALYDNADQEEYMNEHIPTVYITLENRLLQEKENAADRVSWETFVAWAENSGIFGKHEIRRALEFLHDLGSLYFFRHESLKDQVIINPQWIIDVLACVVRPLERTPIQNGRLKHSDLQQIWSTSIYPAELHQWLLRVTEEFDLSFPLTNEKTNLVPCLLLDDMPLEVQQKLDQFSSPSDKNDVEIRMHTRYRFRFLPAGLFNRLQVRLYQLTSKPSLMWKSGSWIKKGTQEALIMKISEREMVVKASGAHPESFLFLIHEVLDTLIEQSFSGVNYDYLVPCVDCVRQGVTLEQVSLLSERRIRLARKRLVPFLQCENYFHVVTVSELQNLLTPDFATGNFDQQLAGALQQMNECKRAANAGRSKYDILMHYSEKDKAVSASASASGQMYTVIKKLKDDLVKAGLTVALKDELPAACAIDNAQALLELRRIPLILICMTASYSRDPACLEFVVYVTVTMNGAENECGLCLANELYVDLSTTDNQHESRLRNDLLPSLKKRIVKESNPGDQKWPEIFLSYCWLNSKDAAEKEKRLANAEQIGWLDPRQIKQELQKLGFQVWLDIEQTSGSEEGLFASISNGLKHAKLIIACVSDEYARSQNCKMELIHARNLKLPILVCIVGRKKGTLGWRAEEVGMLVGTIPDSDTFDFRSENVAAFTQLVESVRSKLRNSQTQKVQVQTTEANRVELQLNIFRELVQIAQSRLLRQLAMLALLEDQDGEVCAYPRLVLLDTVADSSCNDSEVQFCFRFLCENEAKWHFVQHETIQCNLTYSQVMEQMLLWAPYLARLFAILENLQLQVNICKSHFKKLIIQNCGVHDSETFEQHTMQKQALLFERAYRSIRKTAIQCDLKNHAMQYLANCILPTRQELWLCDIHQRKACARRLETRAEGTGTKFLSVSNPNKLLSFTTSSNSLTVPDSLGLNSSRPSTPIEQTKKIVSQTALQGGTEENSNSTQIYDRFTNNFGALARSEVKVQSGKQIKLGVKSSSICCTM